MPHGCAIPRHRRLYDMNSITVALMLLLAVVVSGLAARLVPATVPRPLVQIALGAAIGLVSHLRVQLDPEIFFLLFLPPLLFLDGWRIPTEELYEDRKTILGLALGLVVFTVFGVGFLVHLMVPAMPLPVAFAFAAVVSPTDPIAVSAIAARVPIPRRMMHILEGESLLNDASGLVCLRFAIAATLTGSFSLMDAGRSFLWISLGGVAVGVGITWIVIRTRDSMSLRLGDDPGSQILTSLLIPFAAYLAAERIHCSGILAAVAAGLTMSAFATTDRTLSSTRVRGTAVWDMVQFGANGVIFVLLGEQLPAIITGAVESMHGTTGRGPWWLVVYVLAITAGLGLLRFVWVWLTMQLSLFGALGRQAGSRAQELRLISAFSVAGVRGAVTLAGVLTLPLTMTDGSPFPARSLAIFLAAGVIVLSLIVASLGLPAILPAIALPMQERRGREEIRRARTAAAESAIAAVQQAVHAHSANDPDGDATIAVAGNIIDSYRSRIARESQDGLAAQQAQEARAAERRLQVVALRAERAEIFRRIQNRELGSDAGRTLVRDLDLLEARYRT
jgi:CPA1 family monovalent cation:H+ antiporter